MTRITSTFGGQGGPAASSTCVARSPGSGGRLVTVVATVALVWAGLLAVPVPAHGADDVFAISGGSGGGGGAGRGGGGDARGGRASGAAGGGGGIGGYGAWGAGNAGGGGGASRIEDGGTFDPVRSGGDAVAATPGLGGTPVKSGETAGADGSAASGDVGGAGGGGASVANYASAMSFEHALVYGGNGGRGGQGGTADGADGGHGGDGGSVDVTWGEGGVVAGELAVVSGQGGGGARDSVGSGTSGTGGVGGDARLTVAGSLVADTVYVFNGGNGDVDGYGGQNPGAGGDVSLVADSLAAPMIQVMQ
ncbi:MAG: hypothetical protein LBK59_03195, partial [Bifidobacteriaceae bacterium]|nr:hypothetical protein [Bifidobacteriaceae bacterium]